MKNKTYTIYRARKTGDGCACSFSFNPSKLSIFVEMSSQKGVNDSKNAVFDWDNKIVFKLGIVDIGEILSVLNNYKPALGVKKEDGKYSGLFHTNNLGNAILHLIDKEYYYYFGLSVKRDDNRNRLSFQLSTGEAQILTLLLESAVKTIYGW